MIGNNSKLKHEYECVYKRKENASNSNSNNKNGINKNNGVGLGEPVSVVRSQCIKFRMYNSHIFYFKNVLIQLVKALVYVQKLSRYNFKITQQNPLMKNTTLSTRILWST